MILALFCFVSCAPMSEEIKSPVRPTLLTVLCYISMIISSFMFMSRLTQAIGNTEYKTMKEDLLNQFDEAAEKAEGPQAEETVKLIDEVAEQVEEQVNNASMSKLNLAFLLANLATLMGAFLMFRMRKIGFHFYLGGSIILLISGFLVFGSGFIAWSIFICFFVSQLIFTTLYARQVKWML